ncbi:MAG TPA: hypothetical protein VMF58_04020 [Rhizomicrobium sp.]|nr:hypothetical protein [Rhizomicrobium sp.]
MKTILALTAAAVVAATGTAHARAKVTDISLDGYCDIYHVRITGVLAAAQDTPSCTGNFGGGFVATVKGFGKSVDIALQDTSNPGVQLMLELSYPFTSGGTFHLYQTTDGVNFIDELDGTYSLDAAAERGVKSSMPITKAIRR